MLLSVMHISAIIKMGSTTKKAMALKWIGEVMALPAHCPDKIMGTTGNLCLCDRTLLILFDGLLILFDGLHIIDLLRISQLGNPSVQTA